MYCAHGWHLSSTWHLPFMPLPFHLLTLTSRFARVMVHAVASASCWHLSLSEVAFSNLAVSFPRFSLRRCIGGKGENNSTVLRKPLLKTQFTLKARWAKLHNAARYMAPGMKLRAATCWAISRACSPPHLQGTETKNTKRPFIWGSALMWIWTGKDRPSGPDDQVPMANTTDVKQVGQLKKQFCFLMLQPPWSQSKALLIPQAVT